jgi:hypothetical protein
MRLSSLSVLRFKRLSVTKKISSTDLLWIFRKKLSSFDDRFKDAPIAIVPSEDGWEVITSHAHAGALVTYGIDRADVVWFQN